MNFPTTGCRDVMKCNALKLIYKVNHIGVVGVVYVSKAQLTSPITAEITIAARPHCKETK